MIFNKKKRPPVINGAHLHTLTLAVHMELAFTELEGRKRGWREAKCTQWVADNGDKRSEGVRERERGERERERDIDGRNKWDNKWEEKGMNVRNVKLIKSRKSVPIIRQTFLTITSSNTNSCPTSHSLFDLFLNDSSKVIRDFHNKSDQSGSDRPTDGHRQPSASQSVRALASLSF